LTAYSLKIMLWSNMNSINAFTPRRNPRLLGLVCLRCERKFPIANRHIGCEPCKAEGHYVSLAADYERDCTTYRYLPYLEPQQLGEGNTPCIEQPALAQLLGVAKLSIKDESQNPTGSHKDRMSAYGIAQAIEGNAHTIVLASSGNAAVSAAMYASALGLGCEVAAYTSLHPPYEEALNALGAKCFRFSDNAQRWAFVAERSKNSRYFALTNHQLPAIGSAPLGIEGYKVIAYECYENNSIPDHIVVPTARGDLAWGIAAGFTDLLEAKRIACMPKVWIVEPFSRLSQVINGASLHDNFSGSTEQFSTAGATVTYLQKFVVEQSNSGALVVNDASAKKARAHFLRLGIEPELCAAATLDAAIQLRDKNLIHVTEHVMLIMTANADRDPSYSPIEKETQREFQS
jgi:threonine synthase